MASTYCSCSTSNISCRQHHRRKHSKDKLLILENDFNIIFTKQQNKTIINKPLDEFKQVKYKTSTTINKELKTIDIKSLLSIIENDDKIINSYNIIIKNIENINNELEDYNKELLLLTSNDDYKYNPECMYCCKRHWVCRMKELEIIINKLVNDKKTTELLVDINDYNKINERNIKLAHRKFKSFPKYQKHLFNIIMSYCRIVQKSSANVST